MLFLFYLVTACCAVPIEKVHQVLGTKDVPAVHQELLTKLKSSKHNDISKLLIASLADADPDSVRRVKGLVEALIAAGEGERDQYTQNRDAKQVEFNTASAQLDADTTAHTTVAGQLSNARDEVTRLEGLKSDGQTAKDEAQGAYDDAVTKLNEAEDNLNDETTRVNTEKATLEEIRRLLNTLLPEEQTSDYELQFMGQNKQCRPGGSWKRKKNVCRTDCNPPVDRTTAGVAACLSHLLKDPECSKKWLEVGDDKCTCYPTILNECVIEDEPNEDLYKILSKNQGGIAFEGFADINMGGESYEGQPDLDIKLKEACAANFPGSSPANADQLVTEGLISGLPAKATNNIAAACELSPGVMTNTACADGDYRWGIPDASDLPVVNLKKMHIHRAYPGNSVAMCLA